MSGILDRIPGSGLLPAVREELRADLEERVQASPYAPVLPQLRAVISSAMAAAAAATPLAAVAAGVAAAQAAAAAAELIVDVALVQDWRDGIARVQRGVAEDLTRQGGRLLAIYRPYRPESFGVNAGVTWDVPTLETRRGVDCDALRGQFRDGYITCTKGRLYTPYPILCQREGAFGRVVSTRSAYADGVAPLGRHYDGGFWWGLDLEPLPQLGRWGWVERAARLRAAAPAAPARQAVVVAPGLWPFWGPWGEPWPVGAQMAAYGAAALVSPPADLDAVCSLVRGLSPGYRARMAGAEAQLLRLLWAREDLSVRAGRPRSDWSAPLLGSSRPRPAGAGGLAGGSASSRPAGPGGLAGASNGNSSAAAPAAGMSTPAKVAVGVGVGAAAWAAWRALA